MGGSTWSLAKSRTNMLPQPSQRQDTWAWSHRPFLRQIRSGETTRSAPNRRPTKSGLCDADLFGGAIPKGPPTLRGVDFVIGCCGESGVFDDIAVSLEDNPLVFNEFYTIP